MSRSCVSIGHDKKGATVVLLLDDKVPKEHGKLWKKLKGTDGKIEIEGKEVQLVNFQTFVNVGKRAKFGPNTNKTCPGVPRPIAEIQKLQEAMKAKGLDKAVKEKIEAELKPLLKAAMADPLLKAFIKS